MDMLKYCEEPCEFLFQEGNGGCGHSCKGNCSECLHGRLHVKCQEECGKTLICGHRCNFPCSRSCPPCQQQCIFSCEHSNCTANCGEPCVQCTVSIYVVWLVADLSFVFLCRNLVYGDVNTRFARSSVQIFVIGNLVMNHVN